MSKAMFSDLTKGEPSVAEELAELDRKLWEEVERVLNWHKVDWKRDGYRKIVTEGTLIFRCR